MDNIKSTNEIQTLVQRIREKRKGFVTNFFFDSFKHSLWIEHNELFCEYFDNCFLLIKRNKSYSYLYFISTDIYAVKEAVTKILKSFLDTCIVDLVGNDSILPLKNEFISIGFREYESLYRMSRVGLPDILLPVDKEVEKGTFNDIEEVKMLLESYFDPFSEQIPSVEELIHFVENGTVLVYKNNASVCGFIIYELIGVTLYLRYWFVAPEFRDKGIGAKLFHAFMAEGSSSKRQMFWVISKNENAIKRYLHYGFSPERLYDYVLIKE